MEYVDKNVKKRKRNTTSAHYETYLNKMESDEIFRSGIVNPTIEPNYMKKEWEKLCVHLNAIGGLELTDSEWKTRFKDWKNSTRAKHRKITQLKLKTGGGPPAEAKLTTLEERGISVWGKVTVTGCKGVMETGISQLQMPSYKNDEVNVVVEDYFVPEDNTEDTVFEEENNTITPNGEVSTDTSGLINPRSGIIDTKSTRNRPKNKINKVQKTPLSQIGRQLFNVYDTQSAEALKIERERNKIERMRLNFEIAKYKFENPSFDFDVED